VVARFTTAIPSSRVAFDPAMQAFLLGWDWRSLTSGGSAIRRVFDLPIFHPEPRALTYMDHMLGETLLAAPVLAATGSVAAGYNFLVLLSFVLSAWFTYRLTRLFGVGRAGAALSGALFAFSAYRYSNLDLLNQLQTQFLPLGIYFVVRYVRGNAWRHAAGALATLAAQVYFGWYYAFYLAIAMAFTVAFAWVARLWRPAAGAGHGVRALLTAAAAFAATLPVVVPYAAQRFAVPEFRRTLGESALYSADLVDYLRWHPGSWGSETLGLPTGPQAFWPGVVTVALAAAGAWALWGAWRRGPAAPRSAWRLRLGHAGFAGLPAVVALTGFVLSLGPILHVAGQKIWIPLPYAPLYYLIPGFSSMRAPARFSVLAVLGLAVLAGVGYSYLERRARGRGRVGAGTWRFATAGLFAIAGLWAWVRPITLLELPTRATAPPAYQWLAGADPAPLLEVPVPATDADESELHALRQYMMLHHGSPRLDGASGFVPLPYRAFRPLIQSFPSDAALDAAAALGAKRVLVHEADVPPERRVSLAAAIEGQPRLALLARFGGDALYELVR
jgi:hypothetical protein